LRRGQHGTAALRRAGPCARALGMVAHEYLKGSSLATT